MTDLKPSAAATPRTARAAAPNTHVATHARALQRIPSSARAPAAQPAAMADSYIVTQPPSIVYQ